MLELKQITKVYETKDFKQIALDKIDLNFRTNEFAAILGASGSGKTTLLNIIGGLDQYTSGDLVINEVSTKKYSDRDWDSYRNHRVGFVFQSYNLISHQSILANVELALTLSGVSKNERKKRAIEALTKVGLSSHINKKPSQLSGGQMQRVAIARALVNNPDIILADEPTGALDSDTSVQIMDVLASIAKEKLVIMVTHNPELAELYASRIIKLKDGHIIDDTNPYAGEIKTSTNIKGKLKKTNMHLMTALSLSLNNLLTKKGRTFLTAFAGSIGIIGIALILSLSNGVQEYIDRVEKETLASYPIVIESESLDMESAMSMKAEESNSEYCDNLICTKDDISNNDFLMMQSLLNRNNLTKFKNYLDNNGGSINDYTMGINYTYDLDLQIYSKEDDSDAIRVNPSDFNTLILGKENNSYQEMMDMSSMFQMDNNIFQELIDNEDLLNSQYEIIAGSMPKEYNEMVLIVDDNNQIPLSKAYSLDRYSKILIDYKVNNLKENKDEVLNSIKFDYDSLVGKTYKLVLNTAYYQNEGNVWIDRSYDREYLNSTVEQGLDIKIVGILRVRKDATNAQSGIIGYNNKLTKYVIEGINNSNIAREQLRNPDINVFTGTSFKGITDTYENNKKILGIVDINNPKTINIYPKNFEAKEKIEDIIKEYNKEIKEEDKITYTDVVGILMNGITTIIDVISYILIAFVAISLVVSSIMIAIITYISVLERTKEIGILRAIGASKKDVSRVFNAETIIEGFISGVLGIGVTLLLCIPINKIIKDLFNVSNIASLPTVGAIVLIIISVLLTVLAGLIPAHLASKKNPTEALRSE